MSRQKKCSVLMSLAELVILAFFTLVVAAGCATTGTATEGDYTKPPMECPEGTRYVNATGVCHSLCDPYNGEKWDAATKGCRPVCSAGFRWDGLKCENLCLGETTWNSTTSSCDCPAGELKTTEGDLCMTMAEIKAEMDKAAQTLIERTAQTRAWIEAERSKPKAETPKCPSGQKYESGFAGGPAQCISICIGGSWDEKQATCRCPQGQWWWPEVGKCVVGKD